MSGIDRWGHLMPFVVCRSHGGPFDDDSFVAGYECGLIDHMLAQHPPRLDRTVHAANVPQLDLIAMRHGYSFQSAEAGDGWVEARFVEDPDTPGLTP